MERGTETYVCQDILDYIDSEAAQSPRLIVADPPYNIGVPYFNHNDRMKPVEYLDWCRKWLSGLYRKLEDGGSFYLFSGEWFASELDVLCKRVGFKKIVRITWYFTFGQAQQTRWTQSQVSIFYYHKAKGRTFNADAIRVPSARQLVYKDKRSKSAGKVPDNVWVLTRNALIADLAETDSVWLDSRVAGTFKERASITKCQLPKAMIERIVLASSNPGDIVLDPFCGSGVVVRTAAELGRHGVGVDNAAECIKFCKGEN